MSRMYSASISEVAVSAIQDLWELVAATNVSVVIHGLLIGQSTDYGDAAAEGLPIQFTRGFTVSGSGGSTVTPTALDPGGAAADATVEANNTTQATTSGVQIFADAFNIQAGYQLWFPPENRITIAGAQRLVVELPVAPTDSITLSSTIFFEELG
ncbi:MAG TPA: hypothetical protein VMX97_10325 [Hyphomicrobiaceae bacterium]|nr:hypothetical protein [Hyphomicrobiaceae bacterium]